MDHRPRCKNKTCRKEHRKLWINLRVFGYDQKKKVQFKKRKKIDKSDFIKTKIFCTSNDTIKNMDKSHTGRKIFAEHICNKGFVSRTYSGPFQLNNKTTQPKLDRF